MQTMMVRAVVSSVYGERTAVRVYGCNAETAVPGTDLRRAVNSCTGDEEASRVPMSLFQVPAVVDETFEKDSCGNKASSRSKWQWLDRRDSADAGWAVRIERRSGGRE